LRRSLTVSLLSIVAVAIVALGATLASGNSPKLGLDLQGGASVVLAPAKGAVVKPGTLGESIAIIRRRVNGLGVSEASVAQQGNNIVVQLPGVKNADDALKLVGQTAQLEFRHVLNFVPAGGVYDPITGEIVSQPASPTTTTTASGSSSTTAPASSPTTAAAPSTTAGPAPSTSNGALGAGKASQLSAAGAAVAVPAATPTTASPATTTASSPTTVAGATPPTTTPAKAPALPQLTPKAQLDAPDAATKQVIVPELAAGTNNVTGIYQLDVAELKGNVISSVNAQIDTTLGSGWTVSVHFNGSGSSAFDALAKKYYKSQVAIVLDGVVESAPTINAQQFGGTAVISGNSQNGGFTHKQANDLALVLRYGSLPIKLEQQTVQKVSATLGKDSLRAGLLAGAVGLILVLLYMILYYRALGLVVLAGLCVSGALMYSIVTALGQSNGLALSLSGVTGIIVSVGVTVDSYIVYFERLKDEIRSGKTVRSSVDRSFSRAWRTIVSADAVSFIGAALLWWLTVDQVRGFAFFLGLSTLLDLLVAYTFTRPMVVMLGRNRTFTQARVLGVARGLAMEPAGGAS
jgi:preprotein translocase subunit SecD